MFTSNYDIQIITKDNCDNDVLEKMASIHQATLPDGFLSTLGTAFLKTVYRELAADPDSHLLCAASHQNNVLGFICGTMNTSSFYRRFIFRNTFRVLWELAPKILSFTILKKMVETLFIPSKNKKIELPSAQLLNFCVSNECQGKGVGRQLFNHLMSWFQRNNISKVTIITGNQQQTAQSFYEKYGLQQLKACSLHSDNDSVVYIWESKIQSLPTLAAKNITS